MSAVPQQPAANDPDALETQEWLDALEAVLEREGPERAQFLPLTSNRSRLLKMVFIFLICLKAKRGISLSGKLDNSSIFSKFFSISSLDQDLLRSI